MFNVNVSFSNLGDAVDKANYIALTERVPVYTYRKDGRYVTTVRKLKSTDTCFLLGETRPRWDKELVVGLHY
jgi:hypothetical protein